MFYRRKFYIVKSDFLDRFNQLFIEINLPNQMKYGSKLVGRFMKDNNNGTWEVFAIWEYLSEEDYQKIESLIRSDKSHIEQIKKWYDENGGKEYIFREKILEVRNEKIISTI
ncbi:MAG: hypothetical protein FWC47_12665 [Oscillospiraceae bacterium]|nr:hypothetical protein [Oscillospiraceae bacterium]